MPSGYWAFPPRQGRTQGKEDIQRYPKNCLLFLINVEFQRVKNTEHTRHHCVTTANEIQNRRERSLIICNIYKIWLGLSIE